jgi:CubicO group peptidase (beta-lactamase class C family)
LNKYARELGDAVAAGGVTGASLAYWDGEVLHTAAAGLRNSVTRDPVTVDTVMHVGSITKVLNAVLLMQLVDEEKIALGDPVARHLPELRLRDQDALGRITCGMLINHSSGINGDWLPEYGPDEERIVDCVNRCADLDQLFAPGEAVSYCNVATVIAGYLSQKLRGTSWYTLARTRVYEPLDMQHSLVDPLDVPRFRCSIGDVMNFSTGELQQTRRPFLSPSFAPAGSTQMTSAADHVTLARALLNGGVGPNGARILSAVSAARMAQPTGEFCEPEGWKIGLGWMITPTGLLWHAGGGRGVLSQLYADPRSGRVLALLTNCDRGGALQAPIIDPIIESWTGIRTAAPTPRREPVDTTPYEGVYESNQLRYEVLARDGRLTLRQTPNGPRMGELYDLRQALLATFHPLGEGRFEADYATPGLPRGEFRFVKPDSRGRMTYLASQFRLMTRTA